MDKQGHLFPVTPLRLHASIIHIRLVLSSVSAQCGDAIREGREGRGLHLMGVGGAVIDILLTSFGNR